MENKLKYEKEFTCLSFVVWTSFFLRVIFEVRNFDPPYVRPIGYPLNYISTTVGYIAFLTLLCLSIIQRKNICKIIEIVLITGAYSTVTTTFCYILLQGIKNELPDSFLVIIAQILRSASTPFRSILEKKLEFTLCFMVLFWSIYGIKQYLFRKNSELSLKSK